MVNGCCVVVVYRVDVGFFFVYLLYLGLYDFVCFVVICWLFWCDFFFVIDFFVVLYGVGGDGVVVVCYGMYVVCVLVFFVWISFCFNIFLWCVELRVGVGRFVCSEWGCKFFFFF